MSKVLKLQLVILLLFLAKESKGQVQIDTNYISQAKSMYAGLFYSENSADLSFNSKWFLNHSRNNISKHYRPNSRQKQGIVVGYKTLGVRLVLYTGQGEDNKHYGKTEQKTIEVSYIKPRSVFEATYKSYDGMYSLKDQIRSDLSTKAFFLRYHYIFNGSQFSYKASFGMGEQQLESATTWLLFANVAWYKVNSDSTLLTEKFPKQYNLTDFKRRGASFGGGYAGSLGKNRMFLSIFANTGLKVSYGNHQLDNGDHIKDGWRLSPNFNAKISYVYNTRHIGAALIARADFNIYKIKDLYVLHDDENLSLVLFYKFKGPKFLEKVKFLNKK